MTIHVLDPTYGQGAAPFQLAPRLHGLKGKTVGLISNGKRGTQPFFAAMERQLLDDVGVGRVVLMTKANYSAPAEQRILDAAVAWDAAFAGIGD